MRSLLERVRTKLADAGGGDGSRWIHGGSGSRPHTAVRSTPTRPTSGNRSSSRPMSAVERPFSARTNVHNASGEVGLRHGRYTRPISSPNWGARNIGIGRGGKRPNSAACPPVVSWSQPQQPVLGNFGLGLSGTEQDALIHDLLRQERVLELVQAAIDSKDGKNLPERSIELAEDDDGVEELNEDGVWVVR